MEEVIIEMIKSGNIVSVLVGLFFYIIVHLQRTSTKELRDQESKELRELVLNHKFEIDTLKSKQNQTDEVLNDLKKEISTLSINVMKLATQVDNLTKVFEELKSRGK